MLTKTITSENDSISQQHSVHTILRKPISLLTESYIITSSYMILHFYACDIIHLGPQLTMMTRLLKTLGSSIFSYENDFRHFDVAADIN